MARVTDLDSFLSFLLEEFGKAGLSDRMDQASVDKLADSAGEWLIATIVQNHLPQDDQDTFRDAYESAPHIFDPAEALYDLLPNFNGLLGAYTAHWIANARTSMSK